MKFKKTMIGTILTACVAIGSVGAAYAATDSTAVPKADHQAKHAAKQAARIEHKAAAKGLTVDQLIALREAHKARKAALEQKAAAAGLSVKDYKAKRKADHEALLEKRAAKKGITVDELKARHHAKKKGKAASATPSASTTPQS